MRKFTKLSLAIAMLGFLLPTSVLFGQGSSKSTITSTPLGPIERSGVVNMSDAEDDWDPYFKTVIKIHEPGIDWRKDQVRAEKAMANGLKDKLDWQVSSL